MNIIINFLALIGLITSFYVLISSITNFYQWLSSIQDMLTDIKYITKDLEVLKEDYNRQHKGGQKFEI